MRIELPQSLLTKITTSDSPLAVWTWEGFHVEETPDKLIASGYQRVSLEGATYTCLASQGCDVPLLDPHDGNGLEIWALPEDVERVKKHPVILAFPSEAWPKEAQTIRLLQSLPPPQIGESGGVISQGRLHIYPLSNLPSEAQQLQFRLHQALQTLASPGDWYPWEPNVALYLRLNADNQAEGFDAYASLLTQTGSSTHDEEKYVSEQLDEVSKQMSLQSVARAKRGWLRQWKEIQRMMRDLASAYWIYHQEQADDAQTEGSAARKQQELEIIARIPALPPEEVSPWLSVMNYQPDHAIRQATLARVEQWQEEDACLSYHASNNLLVYLGNKKHPLPVEEALNTIRRFSTSTVVTARIVLALWHLRRHESQLTKNGSAAIRLDEVLALRGVKKQSVVAYPGTDVRYSNGYRTEDKQAILNDLGLLELCYVRGKCTVCVNGRWQTFFVDSEYLHSSVVYRQTIWGEEVAGLFVNAGDWINAYEESGNSYIAEVERTIFRLNPQNEQHELRIALFLTERWREQARRQEFANPISMEQLLEESVIQLDKKHLTDRFIPRIEDALRQLYNKGILGAPAECLTSVDRSQSRWTRSWLASQWILLPPEDIIAHYRQRPVATPPRLASPRRATRQTHRRTSGGRQEQD